MKLEIGSVLSEAWGLYTRNAGRLIVLALIVFGFVSLVDAVVDSLGSARVYLVPVSAVVTVVGLFWLQGALVMVVQDLRDGRTGLSIGDVFQRVEPRLWRLIVAGLVAGIGVGAGLYLFVIPGLVLITYWSLITPAVVLENRRPMAAISRSMQLVSGNGLRVFVVIVVTMLFSVIVTAVILGLLQPLPPFFDIYVALAWTLMYYNLRAARG